MNRKKSFVRRLAAGCVVATFATCALADGPITADDQYEAGVLAYQSCQHADALPLLTLAAHAGHRHAQEIAGLMNLLGAPFYGSGVATDLGAAMRWFERAAAQGSEIGMRITGTMPRERVVEAPADVAPIPTDVVAEWPVG